MCFFSNGFCCCENGLNDWQPCFCLTVPWFLVGWSTNPQSLKTKKSLQNWVVPGVGRSGDMLIVGGSATSAFVFYACITSRNFRAANEFLAMDGNGSTTFKPGMKIWWTTYYRFQRMAIKFQIIFFCFFFGCWVRHLNDWCFCQP